MKKKIFAVSAMALCGLGFSFGVISVNATSNDIVTNDEFVFDANDLNSGYNAGSTIANNLDVKLTLGDSYEGSVLSANFDFGDYNFQKALLATESNSMNSWFRRFFRKSSKTLAQYYISAEEGTKCGIYYTVVDKTPVDNTYYVSNTSTVNVIKEKSNGSYSTVQTLTEQLDYMYYSEFTFGSEGTVGLMSDSQYVCLFGVTVITEEEIENRSETNAAIDALISAYETDGLSTSAEFTALVEAAKDSLEDVNHYSQIENLETYNEILTKYNELVEVENKINELVANTNARSASVNVSYDAETKALLDEIAAAIANANSLGISNESISNYGVYEYAMEAYAALEADYQNAQAVIEAINNLGDVEYTEEYKAQLDSIASLCDAVNDLSLITNYADFTAKQDAFNQMSAANVAAFVEKVNAANEVKGETTSYALINEAEELYNALIASDMASDEVVAAYNTLEEVKAAYSEYEATVTANDVTYTYAEDGTIDGIFFIGTINNFTCSSDMNSITMTITDETTGEVIECNLTSVYKSLKLRGVLVKEKIDGVRYIFKKICNAEGQYDGDTLTMTYTIVYNDGHVVTSDATSVTIGA